VLIKLGLYGLLRVMTWVPPPAWFGVLVAALGLAGAIVGISLALYQRDMKRVLAYSSVENVGIVLLGIGTGAWASARGEVTLAATCWAGGLLHLWNHAAMKGLMFLGAGSIFHGVGTRDVERLGGLLRRMRWTGALWLFGAVAIAGMPPLNGFASEWLIYGALAHIGVSAQPAAALSAISGTAMLALVGALAALCFVRLIGIVLLGQARSAEAARAHESPLDMTLPIALLAGVCLFAAFAPDRVVRLHAPLVAMLIHADPTSVAAPVSALMPVVWCNLFTVAALVVVGALLMRRTRATRTTETWGCGYAAGSPRMQYTGRSFAELLVDRLLPQWLRPRRRLASPEGVFPAAARDSSEAVDPFLRSAYEPFLVAWGDRFARLRWLQRGSLHLYLLYIVVALVLGLGWASLRQESWP
jgi:hydrogenase-4 component B